MNFETALIELTAEKLKARLPSNWQVQVRRDPRGRARPDALINILSPDGTTAILAVEAISGNTARYQRYVMEQMRRVSADLPDVPSMAVAPYLSPRTRDELRRNGFSYADSTGNLFLTLDAPAIFIEAIGSDRDPSPDDKPLQSLKGPAAGRAIRALCDFKPPYGIRELAQRTDVPAPTLSRVVEMLEREGIAVRSERRGPILSVDWQSAIRLWTRDYAFVRSNQTSKWLEPRGLGELQGKLRQVNFRYAVTGSLAAYAVAPITSPRLAALYVDRPDEAAKILGLRPAEVEGNVLLAQPYDPAAFARGFEERGLKYAAYTQVVADLLTGPGRSPAEGEELIEWMRVNERAWRA